MKRMFCMMISLILLCGLLPAAGTAETNLADARNDSQHFTTKMPEGHTCSVNDSGQMNIWLANPGYVPNIWIHRRDDKLDPAELLYKDYPAYMAEKYGEKLRATSTHEYLEFGGKKLPAVSFIYKDANGYSIHQINLMEVRDDGDVEYQVRYSEEEKDMALEALDIAVQYYQPDAVSQNPAPSGGFKRTGKTTETQPTDTPASTQTIKTVRYRDNRFSIMIPEGWEILTSGDYMTFCFKVWDPSSPDRCFFMFMKLEPALKSEQARAYYWDLHKTSSKFGDNSYLFFAKAPVMEKCDLASFLKIVPEGAEYGRYFYNTGLVLNPDVYPQMQNAKIVRNVDGIAVITATDDAGKKIEGIVTATPVEAVVPYYVNGVDMSSYTVYGFTGITVPEGEGTAWLDVLLPCLCSFAFNPKYVEDAIGVSNAERDVLLARGELMSALQEAMVKAWVGY